MLLYCTLLYLSTVHVCSLWRHIIIHIECPAVYTHFEGDTDPIVKPKLQHEPPCGDNSPVDDSEVVLTADDVQRLAENLRQHMKIDLSALHESADESCDSNDDRRSVTGK